MKSGKFEGWYFKQNTTSGDYAIAFVVGRASDKNGNSHSFIQVNHSKVPHSYYFDFPIENFSIIKNPLEIRIGNNSFSLKGIDVNIKTSEIDIKAKIKYHNIIDIKRNILSPSIMGLFGYLPFLECYHEIYSLFHTTSGIIKVNDSQFDFNRGEGYIEADFGTSFPKSWIWLQSNNFQDKKNSVSLMCAIAKVPILSASIIGLICVFFINGKEYRFSTYNNSKINSLRLNNGFLEISISKGDLLLNIKIRGESVGELKAPVKGSMDKLIKENINAVVNIEFYKNNKIIYSGIGINAGFEINDFEDLIIK